ncbi:MAG: amidase [Proteobacteria bacterium]|nr:amidase [Pseudomonadota bacterium]
MTDVLGDLDAVGVAEGIRRKDFTAQEALEAAIARVEKVNPELNFMATKAYDYGHTTAAKALSGPFAGVPTLIKDLLPLAGLPTKYGCRGLANFQPSDQSPYADALLASGLVPLGKSTTPEFGLTATTEPLLGGPTRNPWDTAKSSGGSSGGAAVAVASRAVPIAHASDGGGSIRIPASCNGLFGLKVSRDRTIDARSLEIGIVLSVNCCVSRSVRDTATWLSISEQTGSGAALPATGMVSGPNKQRLRIGLSVADARGEDPDADVRDATHDAATVCRDLGHQVREIKLPTSGPEFADAFTLAWAAIASAVSKQVRMAAPSVPPDQVLEPLTIGLAGLFDNAPEGAFEKALAFLHEVEARYAAMFSDIDVLLTPVLGSTPPKLGEIGPNSGMEGFAQVQRYVGYTPLQNAAGAPAISVPLAWSPISGMPIGAHFSAAKGQERRLLELAYELEQAKPWIGRKPAVNAG